MATRERALTPEEYAAAYAQAQREQQAAQQPAQDQPQARKEEETKQAKPRRMVELGVMALAFGVPLWWTGAMYTLDGWVMFLNVMCKFLRIPGQVPAPSGWWILVALAFGYVYSRSEIAHVPLYRTKKGWVFLGITPALVWLVVIGTDIGSTFLGVTTPTPDAWPIALWAAKTQLAAAAWSIILTFLPDRMILYGARQTGLEWALRFIKIV